MTKVDPIRLIQQATEEDSLLPLGEYAARDDGNGYKTTYPSLAAQLNDVNDDTTFKKFLDQDTGALVVIPADEPTE